MVGIEVEGIVDSLTRWGAAGWAWNPREPNDTLFIEALQEGKVIASAAADQVRQDLIDDGKGTGRYGFTLIFGNSVSSENLPVIRALTESSSIDLHVYAMPMVSGFIESFTRTGAVGWAWMSTAPNEALQIEVSLNGKTIGRTTANRMRPDVAAAGHGTGLYGFVVGFEESLTDEDLPLVFARSSNGESGILRPVRKAAIVGRHAEAIGISESTRIADRPSVSTFGLSVEGSVDNLTRWGATGWAWVPTQPERSVKVEAVQDGRVVGSANADQMRPDLAAYSKGTGLYGFVVGFERALLGDSPVLLRVIGPEGPTVLPGTNELPPDLPPPRALETSRDQSTSQLPAVEGSVDILTRGKAEGWAWLPAEPMSTMQIEAVLGGRVIGRAFADTLRPDLAAHGKGTGAYGFSVTFDEFLSGKEAPQFRALAKVGDSLPGPISLPPITAAEAKLKTRGSLATLFHQQANFTSRGPAFEEYDPSILANLWPKIAEGQRPLLLAFYLPQFHSIPENDRFWGKGFTEWRQLPRGISRFPDHYQPRIPRDLGFYDLNSIDTMRTQAELARSAAVGAFAYYYYWFNRKRVLEKPLNMFVGSDIDMPFLIIWANENWTRTWDGSEADILLKQDYNPEDDDALVGDIARYFADPRYVKIDGRPLFIIYNPKNIINGAETISRWRSIFNSRYSVDPLMFMAQTFGQDDPAPYGLDGAIEFPPHKLSNHLPGRATPDAYSPDFAGRVIAFDEFVDASLGEDEPTFPIIKTVVPSWDNDARRPNRGLTLEQSTPAKYEAWLKELIKRAIDKPVYGTPIVAINAWNEWAESAYLEPDVYFGSAYLNATARAYVSALAEIEPEKKIRKEAVPKVSVLLPCYNHARYLPERIASILSQTAPPDEIIFLDDFSQDESVEVARDLLSKSEIPYRIILNSENSGCVFRQWVKGIEFSKNELVWIAETDDSADKDFLEHVLTEFSRDDVLACFGRIVCVDQAGIRIRDLDNYYEGMRDFSWNSSRVVPAYTAFSHDFAIKNVIPNASGLVFRKPTLTQLEKERLYQYRFAGDWLFYALVLRGGSLAYARKARSLFRINQTSTSRSAFFTERHLEEHRMILEDISQQYEISDAVVEAHADALSIHLSDRSKDQVREALKPPQEDRVQAPIRVCIAAHSFAIGGGEILPLELANELKGRGLHVTYLVMEPPAHVEGDSIRRRLRGDIPVVYWDDVREHFATFIDSYGIQVINSHNVSVEYQMFLRRVDVRVPYIASLHGGYETVPALLTPEFIGYVNQTVNQWLFLADKNKTILTDRGVPEDRFHHIFNAVAPFRGEWINRAEFRERHGIHADAFVFVLCSRAIEEKGWRTAIEVVQRLSARGRPVHLVLIGDGPVAGELRQEYGNSPRVTFLGQIDGPMRYLKCFEMGIFPTRYEGETFPLFLLECFESGLPVATTDIGEIPRIMEGVLLQTPGLLADHRSDSETLAAAFVAKLEEMFDTTGAYDSYRAGAGATSERFSIEVLGELYENTFLELVSPDEFTARTTH